jgi:hypothetical protein
MLFKVSTLTIPLHSYQEEDKAIVDQGQLKKKELPVFIKMVKINNKGTWFRVLIGPYSDAEGETVEEAGDKACGCQ